MNENIITYIVSSLSLFGSLILICSFLMTKLTNEKIGISRELIFYLSITDFLQSIFFLSNYNLSDQNACKFLAMFGIFAAVSSFIWTVAISHFVWRAISSPTFSTETYPKEYHFLSWGLPTFIIIILLISSSIYSPNNNPIGIFGSDNSVGIY